jgi:hypothetical protein
LEPCVISSSSRLRPLSKSIHDKPGTLPQWLKRKGLVEKIPHAHRYRLTSLGRRVAVLFTKAYGRVLAPGLCALDLGLPEDVIERNELSTAWRCFDQVLDAFIQRQLIAA